MSVKITGLDELVANLEKMATKDAAAIVRKGLRAEAKALVKELVIAAPRTDRDNPAIPVGFMAEHIDYLLHVDPNDPLKGAAVVGPSPKFDYPDRGGGYHEAKNRKGNVIRKRNGGAIMAGRMSVWAVANILEFGKHDEGAKPFMKPTWDRVKSAIEQIYLDVVKKELKL
jgi:HK97 gp10 family phage protein